MTHLVIGIDIGLSGALAAISASGLVAVIDMPTMAKGKGGGRVKNEVDPAALNRLLREWCGQCGGDEVLVVIEQVSSMPGQGVAGMFSLGDSKGAVRGVVAARGYATTWVTASAWKRHFGLPPAKELARARAIQLYPEAALGRKKDHGKAEAILIARFGWETLR
ncbi:MAG: hypothetical protein Q7R45_04825 [Sulfuricaulis sp.]|nr:hypothetical protein [Sulfuricaulis sp.]